MAGGQPTAVPMLNGQPAAPAPQRRTWLVPLRVAGAYLIALAALGFAVIAIVTAGSNKVSYSAEYSQTHQQLTAAQKTIADLSATVGTQAGEITKLQGQVSSLLFLNVYSSQCSQAYTNNNGAAVYTVPCAQAK
jgi:type II secretory pathway component PulL